VLARLQREFPQIARCCGAGDGAWNIVERAIRYGCRKVQLLKPSFDQTMIDRAHAHGIVCNAFWTDDEAEAQRFLDMGIDVLLTNDFHRIARIVAKKEKYRL